MSIIVELFRYCPSSGYCNTIKSATNIKAQCERVGRLLQPFVLFNLVIQTLLVCVCACAAVGKMLPYSQSDLLKLLQIHLTVTVQVKHLEGDLKVPLGS